jgi:hypothetical protein
MTALIVDWNKERGEELAKLLYATGVDTWLYNYKRLHAPDFRADVILPNSFDLLIIHNNNFDKWEELARTARLIVRYTGGDVVPVGKPKEYWIQRSVDTNSILTRDELKDILTWAEEINAGSKDVLLPSILGGSKRELPLRVLSALAPVGLKWEAEGKNAILQWSGEATTFESAIVERLKDHFNRENTDWPPAVYSRYVININNMLGSKLTSAGKQATAKHFGHFVGPDYLDSALKWMASSVEYSDWNERLGTVRDLMLKDLV